jgi:hypothetical protein
MRSLVNYRGLTLVLAACVALWNAACSAPQEETALETPAPAQQITPEDVEVYGVRLFRGDAGYEVDGQVQNNSSNFALTEFEFRMAMQDCLPTGVCEILAEDVSTITVSVPPGQSAAFHAAPDFSAMPEPQGQLGWHYAVVGTSGSPT